MYISITKAARFNDEAAFFVTPRELLFAAEQGYRHVLGGLVNIKDQLFFRKSEGDGIYSVMVPGETHRG